MTEDSNKVTPLWRTGGPLTPEQRKAAKALFLDALEDEGNVSVACQHAGIARKTAYQWLKSDKAFAKAWADAIETSNDVIRTELFRRAVRGTESYVTSQGRLVMGPNDEPLVERKYSDSLMTLLAKTRMPEFREKQQVEHSGAIEFTTDWGGGSLDSSSDEQG